MKNLFVSLAKKSVVDTQAEPHDSTAPTVYKVGDLCEVKGHKGVVFAISPDGRRGKVISSEQWQCDWDEAKMRCEELGEGWRLPTIQELQMLYALREDKEFGEALSVAGFSQMENGSYWSGDDDEGSCCAWNLDMYYGGSFNPQKYYHNYVRAVAEF